MNTAWLALFPLPFMAMGYFCIWAGRADIALGRESKKWAGIRGTVQSLTPLHVGVYGQHGGRLRWRLYVRYHYEIDGQCYWGDWKSPPAGTVDLARKKCAVEEGGPIVVYPCPENPRLSVAVTGLTLERLALSLIGAVFVIFPVLLVLAVMAVRTLK